jgi:hypothetical protein
MRQQVEMQPEIQPEMPPEQMEGMQWKPVIL